MHPSLGQRPITCRTPSISTQATTSSRHPSQTFNAVPHNVCIIGGGVIGLTTALRLQQQSPTIHITIIAEKLASHTTSEGAAGLWKPFAISDPRAVIWGKETFDHYMQLWNSPSNPPTKTGIFLTAAYELFRQPIPDPDWASIVPCFRRLSPSDITAMSPNKVYSDGYQYHTIIAEGRLYMQWLLAQLCRENEEDSNTRVKIERRRVDSLHQLVSDHPYDAIINCTGLGARELVRDTSMIPIRGHVLRVRAPWIHYHIEAECAENDPSHTFPTYIIPNSDTVVIGGTKQVGDEDLKPKEHERKEILKRAIETVPSLAGCEVVGEWVGLRPGRPTVRLEVEDVKGVGKVVHNYGHGGSGLTLAWGCAGEAIALLMESFRSDIHRDDALPASSSISSRSKL